MTLSAEIAVTLGTLEMDLTVEVRPGEVLALLGPNGAGKTTVLRAIAGLQPIDRGRITLGERVLDDPSERIFIRSEGRPVGVVFQDYLLFPHLTVRDNIAFGPRARGVPKPLADTTAAEWIDRVGLTHLARSKPSGLSGGEAQRVALARALATDPQLLLLDEPLAALDVTTRATVRRDLRLHLAGFDGATVMVTHDPLDALALADHVVILESGSVTQAGTIAEVTARPRTPYVAELLGVNLLRGSGDGHQVSVDSGATVTTGHAVSGETLLLVRPSSISLHVQRLDISARNQWHFTVTGIDLLGDHVRVRLSGEVDLVAEITPAALGELGLVEGMPVWASVKATDIAAYPA
ncbi:MAG TPA: ATP-binding cassette domain-containing protein [Microthrixaceae bacterium]|nr:ATP-binding cassette domain-containing protein [Microthrixaceae bacterium]